MRAACHKISMHCGYDAVLSSVPFRERASCVYPIVFVSCACLRYCISPAPLNEYTNFRRHTTHDTKIPLLFTPQMGGRGEIQLQSCVVAPPSRGLLGGEEGKGGVADRPRPSELVKVKAVEMYSYRDGKRDPLQCTLL